MDIHRRGWAMVLALQGLAILLVESIEVHTPTEVEAANGTDTRLKCSFTTSEAVGPMVTVTWTYKPQHQGATEHVFYYHGQPYPPDRGTFRGRAIWDGNINKNDASIMIRDLRHSDNGTFTCQVKNPPDVSGLVGEIQLRVVERETWSEMYILALAIGGASLVITILVLVVVILRHRMKNRNRSTELSMAESKEQEMVREKMMECLDPDTVV